MSGSRDTIPFGPEKREFATFGQEAMLDLDSSLLTPVMIFFHTLLHLDS